MAPFTPPGQADGGVTLTPDECGALFDLIDMLSGCNPENVFARDGTDDPADPAVSACVKVFRGAERPDLIPEGLR